MKDWRISGSFQGELKQWKLEEIHHELGLDRLEHLLRRLDDSVRGEIEARIAADQKLGVRLDGLTDRIGQVEEELREMTDLLTQLMREVKDSFLKLHDSVDALRETTKSGNDKIFVGIKASEETARDGLRRVSSGVAIVDILKAAADADETETAISRSLDEIDARRAQVQNAVEEKRQEFDDHFSQVYEGFEHQLEVIGQHILELQASILETMEELEFDEDRQEEAAVSVREVQTTATDHRSALVEAALQEIDFDELRRFEKLRNRLDEFLQDDSAFRIEGTVTVGDGDEVQPVGFPTIAVRRAESEFQGSDPSTRTFTLAGTVHDCYSAVSVEADDRDLRNQIHDRCSELIVQRDRPVEGERIAQVKKGFGRLVEKGLLESADRALLEEHLDAHTLYWLDSREEG